MTGVNCGRQPPDRRARALTFGLGSDPAMTAASRGGVDGRRRGGGRVPGGCCRRGGGSVRGRRSCRHRGYRSHGRHASAPALPQATPAANAADAATATEITARQLLPLVIPAIVVGCVAALLLLAPSDSPNVVEDVVWTTLPDGPRGRSDSPALDLRRPDAGRPRVGLVVTFVPGHAGPDPATTELAAPPLPLGVAAGPRGRAGAHARRAASASGPRTRSWPINVGLAAALGLRLLPRIPVPRVERARLRGHPRRDVRHAASGRRSC